jgi:hypothetical protein
VGEVVGMTDRGMHIKIRGGATKILQEIIDSSDSVDKLRKNIDELCVYFSLQGITSLLKEAVYISWKEKRRDERGGGDD